MHRLIARRAWAGRAGGPDRRAGFSSAARAGRLKGKIALITGAARGIGRATAEEFIREGAAVILADVDAAVGSQAAAALGPRASFVACDVSHEPDVSAAVDHAVSLHGRLDVMHNNAGVVGPTMIPSVASLDLADFDRVMAVNARGALAGIKHAARVMGPNGSGSILCTASVSGLLGGLGPHPYTISKFTLTGIVRSVAGELGRLGIRVNCISPFVAATPMAVEQFAGIYGGGAGRERLVEMIGGLGELKGATCEATDVAKAAVYLASDEAKYVTGHNLVVDGGFTTFKHLNLRLPDGN